MKKRILSMLLVIVMVLALVPVQALAEGTGTGTGGVTITSVAGTELSVYGKLRLSATVTDDLEDKTVRWESQNPDVATVNEKGVVTGRKVADEVAIIAYDKWGRRDIIKLKVVDAAKVTLLEGSNPLTPEQTLKLSHNMGTEPATWSAVDPKVAIVDQYGVVTAVGDGSTNVYAKFKNGTIAGRYKVTVKTPVADLTGFTLSATDLSLTVGQEQTVIPTFDPADATDTALTWSSDNTDVATVDAGKVTAVGAGTATITAKHGEIVQTVRVTVTEASVTVDSVIISGGQPSLRRGESMQLSATVLPENATDKNVTWTINPESVGLVSEDGLVTLNAAGSATTATVTATCGGKSDTLTFNIADPVGVDSVKVSQKYGLTEVPVGGTLKLQATVEPDTATDKTVTWSSSNTKVAKVDENGLVTGIAPSEEVTITATCGDKSDSYTLKVTPAAQIVLDPNLPTAILAGDKVVLKAELVNAATGEKLDAKISWKLAKETDAYYASVTNGTLNTKSDLLDQFPIDVVATVDSAKFDAEPVTYTVNVVPRASAITLTVDGKKVNDKETVLNLEEESPSITIQSSVSPSKAEQGVTWELTGGAGIYKKTIESDGSLTLTPSDSNRTGVITVKAVADDGTDVSATTTVRFEKQGTGILFGKDEIPLRGGASVNLGTYLDLGENGNSSTVTWTFADGKTVYKAGGKRIATLSKTGKLTTKPVTEVHELFVTATNTASGNDDTVKVILYPATKSIKITSDDLPGKTIAFEKNTSDRTFSLAAEVKPDRLDGVWDLNWSSSDENIAKVKQDGTLILKNAGKVRITCETTDGSKVKGCLYLEITKDSADVKISAPAKTLTSGESMNLKAKVLTANDVKAANQSVIWSIADEYGNETKAATIFPTGRVTAGDVDQSTKVVITATSVQDSSVSSTLELTILPNTRKTLHVKADDELVNGTYAMSLNDSCVLDGVWLKSNKNATETMADGCTFFSSNTKVATVDEELGVLTAVGYGTSTITVRCYDPIYDSKADNLYTTTITVKVLKKVGTVTIDAPALKDLRSGKSATLKATAWSDYANGIKADNQSFTWEVTENGKKTDVAAIDANGVLTAKTVTEKHTVEVKAISKESGIFDTVAFNIFPADSVKFYFVLNGEEYTGTLPVDLDKGLSGLKVRIHTAFADNKGNITENDYIVPVSWSTSDKTVIQINGTGPQALKVGKATLTAKYKIGNTTYESKITAIVNRTMGSIKEITQSNILVAGKSTYMRAVPTNSNATNKNVLWSVEGPNKDKVSINPYTGKLSAKKGVGGYDVTVTASPVDGSASKSVTVHVYAAATKVEISDGTDVINGTKVIAKLSDGKLDFDAEAIPAEAYQTTFKWTSSNKRVAEVDSETGAVTIKGVGRTVIKVAALDGSGKYAKFTLRVTK